MKGSTAAGSNLGFSVHPAEPTKKRLLVDLFYFPPIEFFVAIEEAEEILIERHDNYQKQTFRNRAAVQLANKVKYLSIPVIGGNKKTKYTEVRMDDSQNWRNIHLRGLRSAYGNAPFFEYFYPELEKIFSKKITRLYDFNLELLTFCLTCLRSPAKLVETTEYSQQRGEYDLRGLIHAKEPFEGRNIYEPFSYGQIFGLNFAPNLSVIDLLFCEGADSNYVISRSKKE